jgi:hypothetical protein
VVLKVYERKADTFTKEERKNRIVLDSSMVEHSAVNRRVVGSSPTRGAESRSVNINVYGSFAVMKKNVIY